MTHTKEGVLKYSRELVTRGSKSKSLTIETAVGRRRMLLNKMQQWRIFATILQKADTEIFQELRRLLIHVRRHFLLDNNQLRNNNA